METMKYTKQLLIGISFLATLLVGSGCTNEEAISGVGSNAAHPVVQTIRATKSDFYNTKQTDVPLTRTETDGYKTTFKVGDEIGIFAIKNNAIVDDVNNMKLTYTAADDGTPRWSLPTGSNIYYYEGVTYIAYYPYNRDVTIEASQTEDQIIKSLVNNSNLQPKDDQSAENGSGYASSDLMIATSSATYTSDLNISLSLQFKHQLSLLVMTPQIYEAMIIAPQNAGFTYHYDNDDKYDIDPYAQNVTLSGIKAFKMTDGSFRAIVNTNTIQSGLSVDYQSKNKKFIHYQGNEISSLCSGEYYALTVKNIILSSASGAEERPLKPGDFVFHGKLGIEIYPGDGELANGKIPDYANAVGIVVTCKSEQMTDKKCNEKGWEHAYCIGLNNSFIYNNSGHTWCHRTNIDLPCLENCTTTNGVNNMNGYLETDTMINYDFSSYGLSLENFGAHYLSLNQYIRPNNTVPDNLSKLRSDWFIPSVGQYYDLLKNLCGGDFNSDFNITTSSWKAKDQTKSNNMYSNLQKHYTKVEKPVPSGRFWCSSEYDAANVWRINFSASNIELDIGNKKELSYPIYAFFAF